MGVGSMAKLPHRLEEWRKKIENWVAVYGITPCPIEFEILSYKDMQEITSYSGFPSRYPHWTFGQEYFNRHIHDKYGLGKIYEIISNTRPSRAFLLEGNSDVIQKLVIAHCYGHADFFTNNIWFANTNKRMLDVMANHGITIRKLVERHGKENVEKFLDRCLSLDNLIPVSNLCFPFEHLPKKLEVDRPRKTIKTPRIRNIEPYMDEYINPKEWREAQKKKKEKEVKRNKKYSKVNSNVINFLLTHSEKLKPWQKTILSIVHEEAFYFLPQAITKIANEGWATFVHDHIMINHVLDPSEMVEFARIQAGVLGSTQHFNPYRIGFYLYKHIEDRWNKGKFGAEYERCEDYQKKVEWNVGANLGKEKVFEVRQFTNDTNFINNYLDEEFCIDQDLYIEDKEVGKLYNHNRIRRILVEMLTNAGNPIIKIQDDNYKDGLLLEHVFIGKELDSEKTEQVLKNIFYMWGKPTYLKTTRVEKDGKYRNILWSCNSEENDCKVEDLC